MKLLFLAAFLLSGCSVLIVPHWNATEYDNLVTIAAESAGGKCESEQVQTLSQLSRHVKYYSEFLPNNTLMASGVSQMDETIQELNTGGRIGSAYCSLKLRTIHTMAKALAEASGGKPQ